MNKNCVSRIIILIVFSIAVGHPSQTRFAGMGALSFVFQDYFNKLDLYDFAKIPAGFFKHDSVSNVVLRGSVLRESWELDSLVYLAIGQAIPQKLVNYAPVEAVSFYDIIPQFDLVPCEIIYRSSRHKSTYDFFGNPRKPQAWGVNAGYSQLQREFRDDGMSDAIRTPSFSLVYSRPLFKRFDLGLAGDGFYGAYSSPDNEEKITLMPFGGGGGISFNSDVVTLGLNGDYHYSSFSYDGTMGSEKFSGHALAPSFGSLVRFTNFIWVGSFNFRWVNLAGTANDEDMGELKIIGYSTKTQILFSPHFARVAGFVKYDNKKPVYTDENGDTWFETAYDSYDFGGGCGIAIARINAGFEGLYRYLLTDDLVSEQIIKSNSVILRCGAELSFIEKFFARGGYIYNTFDPDLDLDSDKTMTNTVTAGFGLDFFENTRIDIAYNYKWMKTDLYPDERVTDHVVFMYFKHTMVKREF